MRSSTWTECSRSAATERAHVDQSATCRNLQTDGSTSTTYERPHLAHRGAFSASKRCPKAASREAPGNPRKSRLAPRKRLLRGPANDPVSMRGGSTPRPTGARRAFTRRDPILHRRLVTTTLTGQPRLDSNRLARTSRSSTNRERPSWRASSEVNHSIANPMTRHRNRNRVRRFCAAEARRDVDAPRDFRARQSCLTAACTTGSAMPRRLANLYEQNVRKQM